ncbi:MAG: hypothetical protein AB1513_07610 [Pseudomonadota bacterium]
MQIFSGILLALLLVASTHAAGETLADAQKLADAGAHELALRRIERTQPHVDDPRWAEWEALRFDLLDRLGHAEETLKRAAIMPATTPEALRRKVHLQAAQAAIRLGDGKRAREELLPLLWRFAADAGEQRALRMLVVESYLADKNGEEAYLAMLRYQQDYQPLTRAEAERFVEGLLARGMANEAINWLAQLDEEGALKLRLRLQAGLIAVPVAVEQARAGWQRSGEMAFAEVMLQAATLANDVLLRIEALEHLANAAQGEFNAGELWRAYREAAPDVANRYHLLNGDDAGWLEAAAKLPMEEVVAARTLFVYLTTQALSEAVRAEARRQLLLSLVATHHDFTALRLFEQSTAQVLVLLDGQDKADALMLLGGLAQRGGDAAAAAEYFLAAADARNDAFGRKARLAAAASLLQTGYLEDALAQYDWLLKNPPPAKAAKAGKAARSGRAATTPPAQP